MKKMHRTINRKGKVIFWLVAILVVITLGFGIRGVKNHVDNEALIRQKRVSEPYKQQIQNKEFIRTIAKPSIKAYQKNYQVLPSIVIAQALVESGNGGNSRLYKVAKNPFGIKGTYRGKSIYYKTHEDINGKHEYVGARFRRYPNVKTAIIDHDQVLSNKFIHRRHVMSYITDAKLLQKHHYATDPNYAKKLISIIKQYHLNKYDLQALNGKSTY